MTCCCGILRRMITKEVGSPEDYIVSYKSKWNEWQPTCIFNSSWIRLCIAALRIAARDSNGPPISSKSVPCCLFVCSDILWWTTADISFLIDIKWTFFNGNEVWWSLSQDIAGILRESHAKHQVLMHGSHDYSQWSDGQHTDLSLFQLMKPTNHEIQDTACLHVVHILQHPTSRPTTRSTQDTMVNALKKNLLPLLASKYGQSTKKSTRRHHQVNEGKSGLEAEMAQALGALRRLRSKKKLSEEKRQEMDFPSTEEKEKWINDYVDRETAVTRKRVQDA